MEIKLFEVRDRATCIPVMAVCLGGECTMQENWLLSKSGYGRTSKERHYVYLSHLEDGNTQYDPYKWNDRTMHEAHRYIEKHFDSLKSGDVIDIEFILGETTTKKITERVDL